MNRRFAPAAAAAALALLAGPAGGAPPAGTGTEPKKEQTAAPSERMRQPGHLHAGVRMMLLERMGNHRVDMTRLGFAVLFLEHETARDLAERIAAEPRVAPPTEGAPDLNSLVPAAFFDLQEELRSRAEILAAAARSGDDAAIARAYGALTETCVRCHAVYLNEPRP